MRKTCSKEVQNPVDSSRGSVAEGGRQDQSQPRDYKSRALECECSEFRSGNLQREALWWIPPPQRMTGAWSPGWSLLYTSPFALLGKISIGHLQAVSDGTSEFLKDAWRHSCRASLHPYVGSRQLCSMLLSHQDEKYLLPQDPTTVMTAWQQVV